MILCFMFFVIVLVVYFNCFIVDIVVFDFGGVLVDWDLCYFYCLLFDDEVVMECFFVEVCMLEWNLVQDVGCLWVEVVVMFSVQYLCYVEYIVVYCMCWLDILCGLIQFIVDLFGELCEQGVCLYVFINWLQEIFLLVCECFDFFGWFEGIVVFGEEQLIKFDFEIFCWLIQCYVIELVYMFYIDDLFKNVVVVEVLGMYGWYFQGVDVLCICMCVFGLLV